MMKCKSCNDPKAEEDLMILGNHFCLAGKRIPPEEIEFTESGRPIIRDDICDLKTIEFNAKGLPWKVDQIC